MKYLEFIERKIDIAPETGIVDFDRNEINPMLKPHQQDMVEFAVRGGASTHTLHQRKEWQMEQWQIVCYCRMNGKITKSKPDGRDALLKRLQRGEFKEVEPGIFENPYYFCKLREVENE